MGVSTLTVTPEVFQADARYLSRPGGKKKKVENFSPTVKHSKSGQILKQYIFSALNFQADWFMYFSF